jgi:hypothetical protein
MIKEGLRLIAIFLLLIIIIMDDFPFYAKMKDSGTQLFLALVVLGIIFYDVTLGFIMGLVLMLIYYEIYKKIILQHEKEQQNTSIERQAIKSGSKIGSNGGSCNGPTKIDFISEAHLLAAQNNIWDVNNFDTEIKSVDGSGAQGLDIGYDSADIYSIW